MGYEEGGQLTEKVRRNPYSIILFDEIEKAHNDVLNILLQVMEDGILTDSQGRKINFKNTIIILTSNLGANKITNQKVIGFSDIIKSDKIQDNKIVITENIRKDVLCEVKKELKPEFLNRIDDVIIFNRLTKNELISITKILLNNLQKTLKNNDIDAFFTDDVATCLVNDKEYNIEYGARPIKRLIQNKIENMLVNKILDKKIDLNSKVIIQVLNNQIYIDNEKDKINIDLENYKLIRKKVEIKKI